LRRQRPDLYEEAVTDEGKFGIFAQEHAGLTQREASAIYHKIEFWQRRSVGVTFADERWYNFISDTGQGNL